MYRSSPADHGAATLLYRGPQGERPRLIPSGKYAPMEMLRTCHEDVTNMHRVVSINDNFKIGSTSSLLYKGPQGKLSRLIPSDSHRTVFTFRSWLDLLDVVLAFWISILKISKLLQNCLHRDIDITSFEKHLESSLDRTPNFCQNLVIFRSKNMYLKESLTRSSTVI